MRMNALLTPTLRAAPADAELASHKLLIRAGFIRQLAAGVYSFLPLAWRSLKKVEDIIREEMNAAGAQELLLPLVHPSEIWEQSGRWFQYGAELLRFQDRRGGDFCLAPTHEEAITALVRDNVRSYKQLPMNLYQVQFKFRDELRPRAGLMRGREFIMKDAYSFDADVESAKASYAKMYEAYTRIFKRLGFDFRIVQADTGNIGGDLSHEFQALADTGEDSMLACSACDWAANVEKAEIRAMTAMDEAASKDIETLTKVHTPEVHSVEEVATFLSLPATQIVKTLLLSADGEPIAVMLRGDHELNEVKLNKLVGAKDLAMANETTVTKVTGSPVGFAGPVGLPPKVPVYVDQAVAAMNDFVIGANEADHHYLHACLGRDFTATTVADLRVATPDDPCPICEASVKDYRGIELGHIFYLSTKYSAPMKAGFLDANGKEKPFEMGCYGIGVSRILPALVEQSHDEYGIKWPLPVAPFEVVVMPLQTDVPELFDFAETVYKDLQAAGVDVLLDDRKERAGVKFKDAELIGIPFQVVIGKKSFAEQTVELKDRQTGEKTSVSTDEIVAHVRALVEAAHARYAVD
jgi:prolyl-tRNA synthetase